MSDTPNEIAHDVRAVGRLSAVPTLLRVLCDSTGMGFAAVARVTEATWTACAVIDDIEVGVRPGGQLDVHSTLCMDSRATKSPIVIECASIDPRYDAHPSPKLF